MEALVQWINKTLYALSILIIVFGDYAKHIHYYVTTNFQFLLLYSCEEGKIIKKECDLLSILIIVFSKSKALTRIIMFMFPFNSYYCIHYELSVDIDVAEGIGLSILIIVFDRLGPSCEQRPRRVFQFLLLYSRRLGLRRSLSSRRTLLSILIIVFFLTMLKPWVSSIGPFNSYYCIPDHRREGAGAPWRSTFNSYYCIQSGRVKVLRFSSLPFNSYYCIP